MANWRALDALTGPEVETAAVVKADAYGLGAERVAPALLAAGVRTFFVAIAEEGAALRKILGSDPEIFVLSGLMRGDAGMVRESSLVPCLNSIAQAYDLIDILPGTRSCLQIDSGMNRLGIEPDELPRLAPLMPRLNPVLAITHLACADDPDHCHNKAQLAAFEAALATLPPMRRSIAATAGILLGPEWHGDLTRPGVGLYGGLPFAAAHPVVTLSLPVIQVRDLSAGETVGYGGTWTADRPARIATVAAGYADGILRRLSGTGLSLYAGDRACPMVGRVSMDLITVDVTDLADIPHELEILNARQTIDDLAHAAGTIGYEILTALGARYDRVYKGPVSDRAPE